MRPRNQVIMQEIDSFLFMLKEDKPKDIHAELFIDCKYYREMTKEFHEKIKEALTAKTHYSKIGFIFEWSSYNYYFKEALNSITSSSSKITLDLRFFTKADKLTAMIINIITNKNCPKDLEIILSNCNISNTEIVSFSKALVSGKCPQGLSLKFDNIRWNEANTITNDGVRTIIAAIQSKKCPLNIRVDISGAAEIDHELLTEMNRSIDKNNKRHTALDEALPCIAFQQGVGQKKSQLEKLPQVAANTIYEYILPSQSIFKTFKNLRAKNKKEYKKQATGCILM